MGGCLGCPPPGRARAVPPLLLHTPSKRLRRLSLRHNATHHAPTQTIVTRSPAHARGGCQLIRCTGGLLFAGNSLASMRPRWLKAAKSIRAGRMTTGLRDSQPGCRRHQSAKAPRTVMTASQPPCRSPHSLWHVCNADRPEAARRLQAAQQADSRRHEQLEQQ